MNRILAEYDRKQGLYNDFRSYCENFAKQLLQVHGIRVHMVDSRLKTRKSLSEKIQRPDKNYDVLEDVTDIAGVRIITYFDDDVDRVGTVIEGAFEIDSSRSVDKRESLRINEFGYSSLHYVLRLDSVRCGLIECQKFRGLACEIQVRSLLQHAWAEIEHDLGYKVSSNVPPNIRRKFSRLASTLEGADLEFRSIRNEISTYVESAKNKILGSSAALEVDEITVRTLVEEDEGVKKVDEDIAKAAGRALVESRHMYAFLANALRSVGLTEIGSVQERLTRDRRLIAKLAKTILDSRERASLGRGVSLSYLYLVTLGEQGFDEARIAQNLAHNSVTTHDPRLSAGKLGQTVSLARGELESESQL